MGLGTLLGNERGNFWRDDKEIEKSFFLFFFFLLLYLGLISKGVEGWIQFLSTYLRLKEPELDTVQRNEEMSDHLVWD